MEYWYALRVYDKTVDLKPGSHVICGPYRSYQDAKEDQNRDRGYGIEKTRIYTASNKEEAESIARLELS